MSNHLESLNVASLDAAQQAFEHWRSTRTQRSSTPEALRTQAVSLIGKHRRSHICTALRINDQALKQWERNLDVFAGRGYLSSAPAPTVPDYKLEHWTTGKHRSRAINRVVRRSFCARNNEVTNAN